MKHKPKSIPGQLLAFFERNPDEVLSALDIAVKFDCSKTAAHTAIARLGLRRVDDCYAPAPVVRRRRA
jgi:hypothetical protein